VAADGVAIVVGNVDGIPEEAEEEVDWGCGHPLERMGVAWTTEPFVVGCDVVN